MISPNVKICFAIFYAFLHFKKWVYCLKVKVRSGLKCYILAPKLILYQYVISPCGFEKLHVDIIFQSSKFLKSYTMLIASLIDYNFDIRLSVAV